MKARHIPRIDIHDRLELKNALPLRTPYVIYIDPCDTCNFKCKFCPSGNIELMKKTKGRGHGPMDFEVYKGIIDSLKDFPDPVRVIRLYKEGEPLVNPHFADMVRYAKQSPKVQRVDTTTNASLLTPERSLAIIDAGLDRLNISVEGVNAEQYRDFSGHKMDYQQFVDNVAFFYDHKGKCEMNIKINGDILTDYREGTTLKVQVAAYPETIEYWPKFNDMKVDFDESVSLLGGKSGEVMVCPYVFYEMCINSDGSYSLCRFDWNHAMMMDPHVSYPPTPKKVWDSITLWNFQQQFLRKERKMMTVLSCPKCGILKQGVPEDLDEFAEEILEEV
mgnify:CR=1 FL=1